MDNSSAGGGKILRGNVEDFETMQPDGKYLIITAKIPENNKFGDFIIKSVNHCRFI